MLPTSSLIRPALLALGAGVVLALACFEVPAVGDYYACARNEDCGAGGLVCDDGVCCHEREAPVCRGRVLDGGTCLDGGVPQRFFEDRDEDGFGDPQRAQDRCEPPRAVVAVTRSGDCNDDPTDGGRFFFPGALGQCDGLDHDCDGVPNNGLDAGLYYRDQDNDGYGDPARSASYCTPPFGWVATRTDCAPDNPAVHPGAREQCNGVDDNCVGGVDEKPDCGGPASFFNDPDVEVGARHLSANLGGQPSECLKSSAYTLQSPADQVSGRVWTGSGDNSHFFWAERKSGTWDLVRAQSRLKLFVTFTTTGPTNRWRAHQQPVVLLCGPAGMLRLVHRGEFPLPRDGSRAELTATLPLPPDGVDWVLGANSTPDTAAVLRQVKRVEVLVQPESDTVGFTATFSPDFGLP